MENLKNTRQKIYNKVIDISFVFLRLRIWSRAGILFYLAMLHTVVMWAIGIPDITTSQAVIISTICGLATPVTAFYINSGKSLYDTYVDMKYNSKWTERIDHIGFIIDKFRLFPLFILIYYLVLLVIVVNWGIMLGVGLSQQQAAFISTMATTASIIFGFFITSGEVNLKMEEVYTKKYAIDTDTTDDKPLEENNEHSKNFK